MKPTLASLAVAAAAIALVGALAGTTFSAFSGSTSSAGNTFAAAASFGGCASAGTVTASANIDSWVDQGSQGSNFGNDQILKVKREGGSKAMRALVRFNLPAVRFIFLTLASIVLAGIVLARVWGIGPGRRA